MIDQLVVFIVQILHLENESLAITVISMLLKFFVPLMLLLGLYKILMFCIYRIFAKRQLSNNKKMKIVFWIRIVLRLIFISLFIIAVKILTGENLVKYLKVLLSVVQQPFYSAGNNTISILTIVMIVPVYYFSSWIGKITYKLLDTSSFASSFNNMKQSDTNNVYLGNLTMFLKPGNNKTLVAAKVLKYSVTVFVFIIGLSLIGINLSSIAVMLGVLGIGLGFGLQNLIANIFAGFTIMLTKVVKEGDFINVRGDRGAVTKINSVSSIVTTRLNETIIVPNAVLISDVIYNESYEDRNVVIQNSVIVAYDSDIDFVRSLMIDIAKRSPYTKKNEEPDPRIFSFDRAGIEIVLYSTITEVVERGPARAWINLEIWREFKKNNIRIPVSQMDVSVKKEEIL